MMVATDGSETAEKAFSKALSLCQPGTDTLIVITIIDAVQCLLFVN